MDTRVPGGSDEQTLQGNEMYRTCDGERYRGVKEALEKIEKILSFLTDEKVEQYPEPFRQRLKDFLPNARQQVIEFRGICADLQAGQSGQAMASRLKAAEEAIEGIQSELREKFGAISRGKGSQTG